jgi:hypothetical protein
LEQGEEEARPVVIAFFSGTGSHNRDFKAIAAPLIRVLETYPQAWLHISGHLELGPEFSSFQTRVRRAPYVSWRELPHLIAQADINLVPLEQDNPFCQAKSENKFVEAALVGVPTIASRVDAYEFAITAGEDGLLAASSQEWENALRALLDDPDRRREIGEAARRTVYERYMPEQHAPKLLGTLQEIAGQYASSSAPPERLLREMAARVRQYANQMRLDGSSQEDQIASLRRVVGQYESQLVSLSRLVERREQAIEKLEQTIEAIMQGRVMRFTTGVERWLRKIRGK